MQDPLMFTTVSLVMARPDAQAPDRLLPIRNSDAKTETVHCASFHVCFLANFTFFWILLFGSVTRH
jgi:hypothetical protein